jgi:hypothetical protein
LDFYESIPFVTYIESDYVFGRWFDSFFEKQPKSIASIHHFQELEEVVCTVATGLGVSIIPSFAIPSTGLSKKIKFYRPFKQRCINQVYAVARSETMITESVKELIKRITEIKPGKPKVYLFDK